MGFSNVTPPPARQRKRTRGLTPIEKAAVGIVEGERIIYRGGRARIGAARLAPSAYWQEQAKVSPFPPPADHTPMVACDSGQAQCGGAFYPWYYGVDCACEDCLNNVRLAQHIYRRRNGLLATQRADDIPDPRASDDVVAAQVDPAAHAGDRQARVSVELEYYGVHVEEKPLATEDEAVLRAQIDRYTDAVVHGAGAAAAEILFNFGGA